MAIIGFSILLELFTQLNSTKRESFVTDEYFNNLWSFLNKNNYHQELIILIVKLSKLQSTYHIEQLISLNLQKSNIRHEFEIFGTFWKYFEQDYMPGFTLDLPLCIIFNALLNENNRLYHLSKNWISNYVLDTVKLIHPLLSILTHPDIIIQTQIDSEMSEIKASILRPFNQSQVEYAIDVFKQLFSLGPNMMKSLSDSECPSDLVAFWPGVSSKTLNLMDGLLLRTLLLVLSGTNFTDRISIELQQSIRIKSLRFIKCIFQACTPKSISESTCSIIYQALILCLDSESRWQIHAELFATIQAVSAHLFRWDLFEQLYPKPGIYIFHLFQISLELQEKMVRSLLQFRAKKTQVLQDCIECVVYHLEFFPPSFSTSFLIILQEFCRAICNLLESQSNQDCDILTLITGLHRVFQFCIRSESCYRDTFIHFGAIFATLFQVLQIIQGDSVFLPQIRSEISSLLKYSCKLHMREVVEGIVQYWRWFYESMEMVKVSEFIAMAELGDTVVLTVLFEILKKRLAKNSKDQGIQINERDILRFIAAYVNVLPKDGEVLSHCWTVGHPYVKEICAHAHSKYLINDLLRLMDRLYNQASLEMRVHWKESTELYCKVFESCASLAGALIDVHKPRSKILNNGIGSSFGLIIVGSFFSTHGAPGQLEKFGIIVPAHPLPPVITEDALSKDALVYISETSLLGFQNRVEKDQALQLFTHLSNVIITPGLKIKDLSKVHFYSNLLKLLVNLSSMPFGFKTWKKEVWTTFIDPAFFHSVNESALNSWKIVIHALSSTDSDHFSEVLTRLVVSTSTGLFASRDQEMIEKYAMFRKLSFLLFSSPVDHYVSKLPAIEEKISDFLKMSSPSIQAEIFFFIQILLVRVTFKNMNNIWLVITHELMRILSFNAKTPSTQPDELHALLEACKALLIARHLQIDEFQTFQWIFLKDCPNLIVPAARDPLVQALEKNIEIAEPQPLVDLDGIMRMRKITDCKQLVPVFEWIIMGSCQQASSREWIIMGSCQEASTSRGWFDQPLLHCFSQLDK